MYKPKSVKSGGGGGWYTMRLKMKAKILEYKLTVTYYVCNIYVATKCHR